MTKLSEPADPVVKRLRKIKGETPDLEAAADLYEAILPLLRDADLRLPPIHMTEDEVLAKTGAGLPLLQDISLDIDMDTVRGLMIMLARAIETKGDGRQSQKSRAAHSIRLSLEEGSLDVASIAGYLFSDERSRVDAEAKGADLDPDLLWTLAELALRPAFHAARLQLEPLCGDITWESGRCYVCGAVAAMGEFRGNNLLRHLRCGRCGADWQYSRLKCLHCGNEDHRTLAFLYTDGEREKTRVDVCEKCMGYLKTVSSFSPIPSEMLQVEDLATLHLDYTAQQRGYVRNPF